MGGRTKSIPENALRTAPGAESTLGRLGVTTPPGGALIPFLSILSGLGNAGEALDDMDQNGVGVGNSWQLLMGGSSFTSGLAGILPATGEAGAGTAAAAALGAEGGLGAAWAASGLGTVGAVLGAAAAGWGVGSVQSQITDSQATANTGWFDDETTRENRSMSDWITDKSLAVDDGINDLIGGEEGSFRDGFGDFVGAGAGMATSVHGHLASTIPSLGAAAVGEVSSWFD